MDKYEVGDKVYFDSLRAGKIKGIITLVTSENVIFEVTSKKKFHRGYYPGYTFQISLTNPWLSRRN